MYVLHMKCSNTARLGVQKCAAFVLNVLYGLCLWPYSGIRCCIASIQNGHPPLYRRVQQPCYYSGGLQQMTLMFYFVPVVVSIMAVSWLLFPDKMVQPALQNICNIKIVHSSVLYTYQNFHY